MSDLLNVDLSSGSAERTPLEDTLESLGGHGLTSAIVARDVGPEADALGPGNALVFAAGLYAGTAVPERRPALRGGQEPAHRRHQGGQLGRLGRAQAWLPSACAASR